MKLDSRQKMFNKGLWDSLGQQTMYLPSSSGQRTKESSGTPKSIALSLKPNTKRLKMDESRVSKLRSTKKSKRLERLRNKEYRQAFSNENAVTRIAIQIRLMREKNQLTQADLAKAIGTKQGSIARLESMDYGKFSFTTLKKIADYFDVVPWVEFVSYSTLLRRTINLSPQALTPAAYSEEFSHDGEPSVHLFLNNDGSAICQSHYVGAFYTEQKQGLYFMNNE